MYIYNKFTFTVEKVLQSEDFAWGNKRFGILRVVRDNKMCDRNVHLPN